MQIVVANVRAITKYVFTQKNKKNKFCTFCPTKKYFQYFIYLLSICI